jgi:ribonuclease HII
VYDEVVSRALAWSVVGGAARGGGPVRPARHERPGHAQAVLRLDPSPSYVLTDGFPIGGMPAPALAVWKGDRVAACVAAPRPGQGHPGPDHARAAPSWPEYDFARHKGYATPEHSARCASTGPARSTGSRT